MTSKIEICNLALGNIRGGSINNIDESSVQAQNCKLRYDLLLDKCLKETNFNFSRKIIALAPVTDVVFNYPYTYRYPNDCLQIERLIGQYENVAQDDYYNGYVQDSIAFPKIPYSIFNVDNKKVISAGQSELRIDYTAKITDPNLFSPEFILALSHLLASEIAIPIVGVDVGRKLRSDSLQIYKQYLSSGIASDSNEKQYTQIESEFVSCRG